MRGPVPRSPLPGGSVYRLVFLLAALDRVGWGCWALLRPEAVFALLGLPEAPAPDQLLLWKVLGGLALVHGLVFVILLSWPEACGPVVLVPLFGLALGAAVWLWVSGTERLTLPSPVPPLLLAAHDAVWLPPLGWFLVAWQRWHAGSLAHSSAPSRP